VTEEAGKQPRREFFKSLGRNVILGLTGAGVAVMIRKGTIEIYPRACPLHPVQSLEGGLHLAQGRFVQKAGIQ